MAYSSHLCKAVFRRLGCSLPLTDSRACTYVRTCLLTSLTCQHDLDTYVSLFGRLGRSLPRGHACFESRTLPQQDTRSETPSLRLAGGVALGVRLLRWWSGRGCELLDGGQRAEGCLASFKNLGEVSIGGLVFGSVGARSDPDPDPKP